MTDIPEDVLDDVERALQAAKFGHWVKCSCRICAALARLREERRK